MASWLSQLYSSGRPGHNIITNADAPTSSQDGALKFTAFCGMGNDVRAVAMETAEEKATRMEVESMLDRQSEADTLMTEQQQKDEYAHQMLCNLIEHIMPKFRTKMEVLTYNGYCFKRVKGRPVIWKKGHPQIKWRTWKSWFDSDETRDSVPPDFLELPTK